MYMRVFAIFFTGIGLTLAAGITAADDTARTAEDIRQCSRQNFPTQTSVQTFDLSSTDAAGGVMKLEGKLNWRKGEDGLAEINICFRSPVKYSGTCYLVQEKTDGDDIFVYLPALKRVKRVVGNASSQTLLGTDLSYEDLKQLQGIAAGGTLTRLPDTSLGEVPVYVLEGKPAIIEGSPYSRVVSHIDKPSCIPLQVDFYEVGNTHRKRLLVSRENLVQVDGRWQIRSMVLRDMRDSTETSVDLGEAAIDGTIAKRVFNKNSFYFLN